MSAIVATKSLPRHTGLHELSQMPSAPSIFETVEFAKAHAALDDFVLLLDMPARIELDPAVVAALCDRRRGLGADGLLRVTVAGSAREAGAFDALPEGVTEDDWFMDLRDPYGSQISCCGSGMRVLAHYLWAAGLERRAAFTVGSLAGARRVSVLAVDDVEADVTVDMGEASVLGIGAATLGGRRISGIVVNVDGQKLTCVESPKVTAELVDSQPGTIATADTGDVLIVTEQAGESLAVRRYRSGYGEVPAGGAGAAAAAVAGLRSRSSETGTFEVRTSGGAVSVTITETTTHLRGPSTLVARGQLSEKWWRAQISTPAPAQRS